MTDPQQITVTLPHLPAVSAEDDLRNYAWAHELAEQLDRNRIPDRYRVAYPKWQVQQQFKVLAKCEEKLQGNGAILALTGCRGVGKTFLACQLIIRRLWKQWEWANCSNYPPPVQIYPWMPYRKLSDLLNRYKALYADFGSINGEELTSARDTLCRAPLLVIDELGDFEESKLRQRMIGDILDRRYSAQVDTVLIANLTPAALVESVGNSVTSRIHEHGGILSCEWPSFREP